MPNALARQRQCLGGNVSVRTVVFLQFGGVLQLVYAVLSGLFNSNRQENLARNAIAEQK